MRARTLAEVQALDAGWSFLDATGAHAFRGCGVRVPTLDALLAAAPGVPLNVEIKQDEPAIEAAVLAVLDRHDARARVLLAAEHHHIMLRIRAAAPDMLTSASAVEVADFVRRVGARDLAGFRPPYVALQVPPSFGDVDIVTAESVHVAHDLGVEVHVWTINEPAEMERLLDLGVDALMSDVPAVAMEVLRRRGVR